MNADPASSATTRKIAAHPLKPLLDSLDAIILGKQRELRLALACLLARGHLLIEDLPGMGKTTLAHALAAALGLKYNRIQFTSDLLPADIIGVSVYKADTGGFQFHAGPVFAELVLADEVNRATPKAQSALLEAMEERQITVDGTTHALPNPFFVIATQNPQNLIGTFPLPESQLDRFLMRIEMGLPGREAERELLMGADRREMLKSLKPALSPAQLVELQGYISNITVSDALIDYVQALLEATRRTEEYTAGLSPRAALGLLAVARAWAYLEGRKLVLPEDIQAVAPGVIAHRLHCADGSHASEEAAIRLIRSVPIP